MWWLRNGKGNMDSNVTFPKKYWEYKLVRAVSLKMASAVVNSS